MSLLCPGFFSLWKGVHRAALIGLLALLVAPFLAACDDGPQTERPKQPTEALGPTATPMPTPTPSRDFWNNDFWRHTDVAEMRVVLDEGLDDLHENVQPEILIERAPVIDVVSRAE